MDFLIPDVLPGRTPAEGILLRRPMPYASALNSLRARPSASMNFGAAQSGAQALWRASPEAASLPRSLSGNCYASACAFWFALTFALLVF